MNQCNVIAIDLAKNVFQVCGFSKSNKVLFNKPLKRHKLAQFLANQPPTQVAMEACYSSHYWARTFRAMGHDVTLLPAQHVTPFVRGNKSDHNDAIAIAEAFQRPHIRPVPIKTVAQQDIQSLHRIRDRLIKQRTAMMNQTRGLLAEYGVIAQQGHKAFITLLHDINEQPLLADSVLLKEQLLEMIDEYHRYTQRIDHIAHQLEGIAKQNPLCQLLLTIPGIGKINSTLLYSAIGDGSQFANARELAVWLGLTPKQYSSGNSFSSGGITKRGNRHLRKQLVHGARAALNSCKNKSDRVSQWANALVARRGYNKACVAMAARIARTSWILLNRNEAYRISASV
jgi:transposase